MRGQIEVINPVMSCLMEPALIPTNWSRARDAGEDRHRQTGAGAASPGLSRGPSIIASVTSGSREGQRPFVKPLHVVISVVFVSATLSRRLLLLILSL